MQLLTMHPSVRGWLGCITGTVDYKMHRGAPLATMHPDRLGLPDQGGGVEWFLGRDSDVGDILIFCKKPILLFIFCPLPTLKFTLSGGKIFLKFNDILLQKIKRTDAHQYQLGGSENV